MKKVRTYLVAGALSAAALTASAGAAPLAVTVYQGNAAQSMPGFQVQTFQGSLQDFLSSCPEVFLPNCPDLDLPGFPGGDVVWPDQTPGLPDVTPPVGGDDALADFEQEVVRLVNEARAENGLPALTASGELSRVARIKSQDMVDNGYFSHNSPTYGTPFEMLTSFGVSYRTAGENIAYGQRSPQEVVTTWMNSPGHRANILNAGFTQIGVGYVSSGNYWTQLFIG